MTYKEFDYELLAHLPSDSQFIVRDTHSAKKVIETNYLGGTIGTTLNPTVVMEIWTSTDESAEELYTWYTNTLIGGTRPFTAFHEIFGRQEYYVLQIIDGLEEKVLGGDNRQIKLNAEVLGLSYPPYSLIEPMNVIANGSISVNITPEDQNSLVEYNATDFNITLDGVMYTVNTAVKVDNILLITPSYPITNYPTEVILNHTTQEHGIGRFSQLISNNSEVERAIPSDTLFSSNDGTIIDIPLLNDVTSYTWDNTTLPFTVHADGEVVPLSTTINCSIVNSNIIKIYMNPSRPIYAYEEIIVTSNIDSNAEIASFTTLEVINNSSIVSQEDNTMINGTVNASGELTLVNMTIPQDRTYAPINFRLELNTTDYYVDSAIQSAGSLSVGNDFIVSDYVSSVNLKHLSPEWGFDVGEIVITNNSTTPRIYPVSLEIHADGKGIDVYFNRALSDNFNFIGDILAGYSLTADGIDIPIRSTVYNAPADPLGSYSFSFEDGHMVYIGQDILMSFSIETNIELAPFTSEIVENNSIISEPNRIVGGTATVSPDGLTITATMSQTSTINYPGEDFQIDHGYLSMIPTDVDQAATALVITLPEAIKDNCIVITNHIRTSSAWDTQLNIATINSSTVIGAVYQSGEVVTTGTYIIITLAEVLEAHIYGPSSGVEQFEVKVNGAIRGFVTSPYSVDGTPYIYIYTQGVITDTDVVTVEFLITDDPQIDAFGPTTLSNNSSIQGDGALTSPIYNMTEALVPLGGYQYLYNAASSGSIYNGKLIHVGDGSHSADTAFEPNTNQYNELGWIDLSNNPIGDGTKYINTGWVPETATEWAFMGIYNLIINVSYDVYVIHYKTGGLADIYIGDHNTNFEEDFLSGATYQNAQYTPPTLAWEVYSEPPAITSINQLEYTMGDFTGGINLILNGEFNTDIADWSNYSATISWEASGTLQIISTAVAQGAYQVHSTTIGETYEVAGEVIQSDGSTILRIGEGSTPDAGYGNSTEVTGAGSHSFEFVATSVTTYVYLRSSDASTTLWDNISLNIKDAVAYITDTAAYGQDAELIGNYTIVAGSNILQMNDATALATTGYTFPITRPWLLVETYNVNGTVGYLGGHWFQSDIGDIDADLVAYKATLDGYGYTSYSAIATLFDGNSTATIMKATNSTPFNLEDSPAYIVPSFVPNATWEITNEIVGPIAIDITAGLVHHYPLNNSNTTTDIIGGVTAAEFNMTYTSYGAVFNGTSSYMTILDPTYQFRDMSVSLWAKVTSSDVGMIMTKQTGTDHRDFAIESWASNISYVTNYTAEITSVLCTSASASVWRNFTVSIDADGIAQCYVDGSWITTHTPSGTYSDLSEVIRLGLDHNTFFIEGGVSSVRIYDTPISAEFAEAIHDTESVNY